ncbi:MAG: CoA-binding protein, partial [Chloroflexota bacterium]
MSSSPFRSSPAVAAPARVRRYGLVPLLALAMIAILVLSGASTAFPSPALGTTPLATRCDGVSLRGKPSTASKLLRALPAGATVVAVARVSGASWAATCAGMTARGTSWWKITAVNGRTAASLFGVPVVYGATSLFRWASSSAVVTACKGVPARTGANVTSTLRVTLPAGSRLTTVGTVKGGNWRSTCGPTTPGSAWNLVTAVNGTSVKARYGVLFLYVAHGDVRTPVIATPAPTAPGLVEECGRAGIKAAVVISAGFGEIGAAGTALEQAMLANARRYNIRLLGPNCLGIMRPSSGLNATFARGTARAGSLGLISQS